MRKGGPPVPVPDPRHEIGLPAFSLPLLQVNGLPLGVQILGAPDGDGALCAVANWMESNLN